jgi:single-strand DNA-binding protein
MNVVTLVCRLGRDPEMKQMPSGDAIASLWVAVNGRKEDDTSWFAVTLFGKSAEMAGEHLTKGRRIGVKGRLRSRQWEDKEGNKRRDVEVVGDSFYFLDSRGDSAPADDLAPTMKALDATEVPADDGVPF